MAGQGHDLGLYHLMLRRLLHCPVTVCRILGNICFSLNMVSLQGSHKRLQTYQHHYCSVCMTGFLGCRWHRYQQSKLPSNSCDVFWFAVVVLSFLYSVFMLNYWIVNGNSEDLLTSYWFSTFERWDPAYEFFLIGTGVSLAYVSIVLLMSLCHIGAGYQIYIHWVHRIFSFLLLLGLVGVTIFVHTMWKAGWSLVFISLQISGPFIHIGLMFFFCCVTWLVADRWFVTLSRMRRAISLSIYFMVFVALLILPLFLHSPCIVKDSLLPQKPKIMAHRGGAADAPENTLAAFKKAAATFGVNTLESDVTISYDGVPYVLHDGSLKRTTNVEEIFPDSADLEACFFNYSQIQKLNAGQWFMQRDPFNTVKHLTEEERMLNLNQSVPSLLEYLELARDTDKKVLFDVKMWDDEKICPRHPYSESSVSLVIKTIQQSRILPQNVLWLYWDIYPETMKYNFTHVASAKLGSHMTDSHNLQQLSVPVVNGQFDHVTFGKISNLREANISVNMYVIDAPWLFSLYWCAGVESVTSNQVQLFSSMERPIWQLSPEVFLIMWTTTDATGFVLCLVIWIMKKIKHSGKSFHAENLTIPTAKFRKNHRTMKEKLLRTADSVQEIDAVGTEPDRWSVPISTDSIIIEFPNQKTTGSLPSTHSGGSVSEQGSLAVQLHRMSQASAISSFSGNSVANDSFEKDQ